VTNKKFIGAFLFVSFLIALVLRLYRIDTLPLYIDETSGHYWFLHQLSLRSGNIFNLFYRTLYLGTSTLTWLLGNNMLGVRFPAAFFGSLLTLFFFLFVRALQKDKKLSISLVSVLLIIFLPWSHMIGRIGYTNIAIILNLILLHLYFFIGAKKIKDYLLSLTFILIALFYYHSMVVVVPVVVLLFMKVIYSESTDKVRKLMIALSFISVLFLFPLVVNRYKLLSGSGRGLDLAIWRDVNTPYDTDKYRALSWNSLPTLFSFGLPPEQLANKLFLNRATANLSVFTRNYLSFFSPDWLFLKGDAILRHSTGMVGAFYPFLLPFMLYGAFRFFKTADPKTRNLFLVWILVSPIPAALTKDGAGYLLRAVTMLPFLTYFCALGLVESFNLVRKNWRWPYGIVIALIGFYSVWSFFYSYFHVYPALSARAYEYGFKELSDFQVSHNNAPMLVVWDGYYHNGDFRFWQKTPFDQHEAFKLRQIVIGESTFWQTFGNLYFSAPKTVEDIVAFLKENPVSYIVLPDRYFVKYPEEIEELLIPVEKIKYPDQTTALEIFTPKLDKKILPR